MGISALDGAYDNEDADHFTVVVNAIASISQSAIYSRYDDFVVVCRCNVTENVFHAYSAIYPALWMGPQVIVENCKPETVRWTPSRT
jgi:hypothetical protein